MFTQVDLSSSMNFHTTTEEAKATSADRVDQLNIPTNTRNEQHMENLARSNTLEKCHGMEAEAQRHYESHHEALPC